MKNKLANFYAFVVIPFGLLVSGIAAVAMTWNAGGIWLFISAALFVPSVIVAAFLFWLGRA